MDGRYLKLKIYISELILDRHYYIPTNIQNNALHDLTLIKMIVACFVGTGSFLIRYSNGHIK
jgi:hypothetical protein